LTYWTICPNIIQQGYRCDCGATTVTKGYGTIYIESDGLELPMRTMRKTNDPNNTKAFPQRRNRKNTWTLPK